MTWRTSSDQQISDGILIGVVMRNLEDGGLKNHLIMNAEKLKSWADFREEVVHVRRAPAAVQGGASPMANHPKFCPEPRWPPSMRRSSFGRDCRFGEYCRCWFFWQEPLAEALRTHCGKCTCILHLGHI